MRLHCPHYPLLDALEGPFPKFLRNTRARIAFCSFFLTICFCSAQQWLLEMLASTHRRPLKNCRLSDKGRRKAHTPSSLLCTTGVEEKKKKKSVKNCCTRLKLPRCRRQVFPSQNGYDKQQSPPEGSPLATSARCHATQTRIARKSKWQTQRNVTRLPTSPFLLGCFYVACSLTLLPSFHHGVSGTKTKNRVRSGRGLRRRALPAHCGNILQRSPARKEARVEAAESRDSGIWGDCDRRHGR